MTKAKVLPSSHFDTLVSSAGKAAASHNMNQVPSQTRPKEASLKAAGKRGSASSSEVRKDVKRKEKFRLSAARSVNPDVSCKDSAKSPSTDSSSETSDCTSEEYKASVNHAPSNEPAKDPDAEVDWEEEVIIEVDRFTETIQTPQADVGERRNSSFLSMDRKWNLSALWELREGSHEDLLKEIDELRSENEYLKAEVEELNSEMQEMRDLYMEEDVYQLQEVRQQLDQANKTCRILQYRLRKAERRSLRVAQTGQVDGELIRTLEHDVQVAKCVSLRLHREFEAMQKKSSQLEWENQELREQLQNLEVAKQVLQAEMDKSREVFSQNSLKRRSLRSTTSKTEKKLSSQDDSEDMKCQVHFAKEESALMCKKLTKMAVECENMRAELSKYRLMYGDMDAAQVAAGTVNSAHTREAEVKVHLRLVEEEATLLSRRIVELEVENRGLRAEMNEMQQRTGWGQEDEDELMEEQASYLATSHSLKSEEKTNADLDCGHSKTEERNEAHGQIMCLRPEDCPPSQILREEPVGVERNSHVLEKIDEIAGCTKKEKCEQGCISLKDLDVLLAIRDQAVLVRSIIQFLIPPAKNGFSMSDHNLISSFHFLNKFELDSQSITPPWVLDPVLSPLNNGMEVLEAQLQILVAKVEDLVKTVSVHHESKTVISEMGEDTKAENILDIDMQRTGHFSITDEQNNNQDSLEVLTLQLRQFLQQWHRQQRPTTACKILEESRGLLSVLSPGLQDLHCELQEENLTGQHIVQEKAASMVECREPKRLISKLKDITNIKMVHLKDYVEKVPQLVKIQCQNHLAWDRPNKDKLWMDNHHSGCSGLTTYQSYGFQTLLEGGETNRVNTKSAPSAQISNKNWLYLSSEAALMDRGDPCRTWDCPITSPSFPELDVKQLTAQKSHTAPEKTSIRIYYSPPSARRFQLSAVTTEDMSIYKKQENQEAHHHFPSKQINEASIYDSWHTALPFQCSGRTEQGAFTASRSNSSSSYHSADILSPTCLPFSGWEVSSNLSDDMKEMTVNVLERRSGRSSLRHAVGVVSTGTQTHAQPQVNSIGLQTENSHSIYAGKHRSLRVSSFVSSRTQPMTASLERIPGPLEKLPPCSNSPRLQRRHSGSSPFSSNSSSSSTSNSSSSFTSSSLSSSTSLTNSSRAETKEHAAFGLPQCRSGSSVWARSSTARAGSASGRISDKYPGRKSAGVHKYGLVHEFFRNVCGRGEKPHPGVEKVPVVLKDCASSKRLKKTEGSPSRIPTVPLVRSDSVTKIVNHRFMKPGRKDEQGSGQTQRQDQCQNQTNKTSKGKNKGFGPVTREDGSCGCSSRTLASCFARVSRTNIHHAQSHCKLRPSAAGGKGNLLSQ